MPPYSQCIAHATAITFRSRQRLSNSQRSTLQRIRLGTTATVCWVVLLASSIASSQLQAGESLAPDVRVLIDISGSMKKNDPGNLRVPALNLIVELLPGQSRAGVWTFGREVNMLVAHAEVDRAWRARAQRQATKINAVALRSNIGGVLEQANYDRDPRRFPASAGYNKSVILLTDGVVDIARDPQVNLRERQRILDTILPQYQSAGVRIHTIALSNDADTDLLKALSEATDGVFAVAETAADLNKVFLRALDHAAATDQVPLKDNAFLIDASVEEFTALVFKRAGSEPTSLTSPGGDRISATRSSSGVRWLSDANYDLVTVAAPLAGKWRVSAALDPDSRVTVVSNLQLDIKALPATMYRGESRALQLELLEDGEPVNDAKFLELLTVQAQLAQGELDVWQQTLQPDVERKNSYRRELDMLGEPGSYALGVLVDGKTFKRQRQLKFTLKQPFRSELQIDKAQAEFTLTVVAANPRYINAATGVYANIVDPLDELEMVELALVAPGVWTYTGTGVHSGTHSIAIYTYAQLAAGEPGAESPAAMLAIADHNISLLLPTATSVLAPPQPAVAELAPEPQVKLEVEPESEPETELAAAVAPEAVVALVEPPTNRWMVYAGLAVGNLLMIGGLVLVYKKITAPGEVDAEAGDESDGPVAENTAAEASEQDAEPEAEQDLETGTAESVVVEPAATEEPPVDKEAELVVAITPAVLDLDDGAAGVADSSTERAGENSLDNNAKVEASLDEVLAELDKTLQVSGEEETNGQSGDDSENDVFLELDDEFDLSSDMSDELPKRSDAV